VCRVAKGSERRRHRVRPLSHPNQPGHDGTDDVRQVFGPYGEMGPRAAQLLTELEALRVQISERTFPENQAEKERLEAATLLVSSACSFVVLALDQLIANDASPLPAQAAGWLRVVSRWAGGSVEPDRHDIESAIEVVRRIGGRDTFRPL
jgi:hypothetical protein